MGSSHRLASPSTTHTFPTAATAAALAVLLSLAFATEAVKHPAPNLLASIPSSGPLLLPGGLRGPHPSRATHISGTKQLTGSGGGAPSATVGASPLAAAGIPSSLSTTGAAVTPSTLSTAAAAVPPSTLSPAAAAPSSSAVSAPAGAASYTSFKAKSASSPSATAASSANATEASLPVVASRAVFPPYETSYFLRKSSSTGSAVAEFFRTVQALHTASNSNRAFASNTQRTEELRATEPAVQPSPQSLQPAVDISAAPAAATEGGWKQLVYSTANSSCRFLTASHPHEGWKAELLLQPYQQHNPLQQSYHQQQKLLLQPSHRQQHSLEQHHNPQQYPLEEQRHQQQSLEQHKEKNEEEELLERRRRMLLMQQQLDRTTPWQPFSSGIFTLHLQPEKPPGLRNDRRAAAATAASTTAAADKRREQYRSEGAASFVAAGWSSPCEDWPIVAVSGRVVQRTPTTEEGATATIGVTNTADRTAAASPLQQRTEEEEEQQRQGEESSQAEYQVVSFSDSSDALWARTVALCMTDAYPPPFSAARGAAASGAATLPLDAAASAPAVASAAASAVAPAATAPPPVAAAATTSPASLLDAPLSQFSSFTHAAVFDNTAAAGSLPFSQEMSAPTSTATFRATFTQQGAALPSAAGAAAAASPLAPSRRLLAVGKIPDACAWRASAAVDGCAKPQVYVHRNMGVNSTAAQPAAAAADARAADSAVKCSEPHTCSEERRAREQRCLYIHPQRTVDCCNSSSSSNSTNNTHRTCADPTNKNEESSPSLKDGYQAVSRDKSSKSSSSHSKSSSSRKAGSNSSTKHSLSNDDLHAAWTVRVAPSDVSLDGNYGVEVVLPLRFSLPQKQQERLLFLQQQAALNLNVQQPHQLYSSAQKKTRSDPFLSGMPMREGFAVAETDAQQQHKKEEQQEQQQQQQPGRDGSRQRRLHRGGAERAYGIAKGWWKGPGDTAANSLSPGGSLKRGGISGTIKTDIAEAALTPQRQLSERQPSFFSSGASSLDEGAIQMLEEGGREQDAAAVGGAKAKTAAAVGAGQPSFFLRETMDEAQRLRAPAGAALGMQEKKRRPLSIKQQQERLQPQQWNEKQLASLQQQQVVSGEQQQQQQQHTMAKEQQQQMVVSEQQQEMARQREQQLTKISQMLLSQMLQTALIAVKPAASGGCDGSINMNTLAWTSLHSPEDEQLQHKFRQHQQQAPLPQREERDAGGTNLAQPEKEAGGSAAAAAAAGMGHVRSSVRKGSLLRQISRRQLHVNAEKADVQTSSSSSSSSREALAAASAAVRLGEEYRAVRIHRFGDSEQPRAAANMAAAPQPRGGANTLQQQQLGRTGSHNKGEGRENKEEQVTAFVDVVTPLSFVLEEGNMPLTLAVCMYSNRVDRHPLALGSIEVEAPPSLAWQPAGLSFRRPKEAAELLFVDSSSGKVNICDADSSSAAGSLLCRSSTPAVISSGGRKAHSNSSSSGDSRGGPEADSSSRSGASVATAPAGWRRAAAATTAAPEKKKPGAAEAKRFSKRTTAAADIYSGTESAPAEGRLIHEAVGSKSLQELSSVVAHACRRATASLHDMLQAAVRPKQKEENKSLLTAKPLPQQVDFSMGVGGGGAAAGAEGAREKVAEGGGGSVPAPTTELRVEEDFAASAKAEGGEGEPAKTSNGERSRKEQQSWRNLAAAAAVVLGNLRWWAQEHVNRFDAAAAGAAAPTAAATAAARSAAAAASLVAAAAGKEEEGSSSSTAAAEPGWLLYMPLAVLLGAVTGGLLSLHAEEKKGRAAAAAATAAAHEWRSECERRDAFESDGRQLRPRRAAALASGLPFADAAVDVAADAAAVAAAPDSSVWQHSPRSFSPAVTRCFKESEQLWCSSSSSTAAAAARPAGAPATGCTAAGLSCGTADEKLYTKRPSRDTHARQFSSSTSEAPRDDARSVFVSPTAAAFLGTAAATLADSDGEVTERQPTDGVTKQQQQQETQEDSVLLLQEEEEQVMLTRSPAVGCYAQEVYQSAESSAAVLQRQPHYYYSHQQQHYHEQQQQRQLQSAGAAAVITPFYTPSQRVYNSLWNTTEADCWPSAYSTAAAGRL